MPSNSTQTVGSGEGYGMNDWLYALRDCGPCVLVTVAATRGSTPRNFHLTPDGEFLLAANQDSDTVASFRISDGGETLEFLQTSAAPGTPYFVGAWLVPDAD